MKNFKDLLSEVAQPKSPEEKAFKDQHKIELIKHPVAPDYVHTGEIPGGEKKKARPADQEGDANYDQAYDKAQKAKKFKMPRNIDESTLEFVGLDEESEGDYYIIKVDGKGAPGKSSMNIKTRAHSQKDALEKVRKQHPGNSYSIVKEELSFKDLMGKVSHSADLLESPQEEVPMMMKQLNFICYASEEIQEYLEIDGLDPEEWWQNKLAQTFGQMKSLYAYAKGNEITNKAIDQDDKDAEDIDDDDLIDTEEEASLLASGMYEEVESIGIITESFDLSESKIDVDYIGNDTQKASHEKKYSVKISMHGDGQAFVSGEPKDVFKFAIDHYGDADDAADNHPALAKSIRYHKDGLEEANFKAGNLRLKNGQSVKIDFKDVKSLNTMMKGLNPKNRKEMETNMLKDKKGFDEILKFATQAGV